MAVTLKTRKPIDKLRPADLRAYPIWEFADDEEGEGDVACKEGEIPLPSGTLRRARRTPPRHGRRR